ncbi:hypothetical protein PMAYCL1PPCAC_08670, partial [Pristionchus mayeri]
YRMTGKLEYGLEWDRDQLISLAATIRRIYWPFSVFLMLPLVLFILIRKTKMDLDCKLAFVAHMAILVVFDVYNGLFYQIYTLLPFPVIVCTGIVCDDQHSPRTLLTILAFWTILLCVPYLFVMMRIHQKILNEDSYLKLSHRSQLLLMMVLTLVLASNVYGFGAWSVESEDKEETIQFITVQKSRTYELQMRFMLSMSIQYFLQEFLTSILFIIPMAFLFIFMVTPIANVLSDTILGLFRFTLILSLSCIKLGLSLVFFF